MYYVDIGALENKIALVSFLLSLCSIAFVSLVAIQLVAWRRKINVKKLAPVFWRDEEGASYSLSFVMLLPFYALFMCVCIECMFMTVSNIGAIHAAQAAVRAAAIRYSVSRPDERKNWDPSNYADAAKKAAVNALVPFASAVDPDNQRSSAGAQGQYYEAYQDFTSNTKAPNGKIWGIREINRAPLTQLAVEGRYASAEGRVSVALSLDEESNKGLPNDEPWRKCIKCSLTYDAPFRISLVGKILGGHSSGKGVVRSITKEAKAQIECPKNETGFLGVAIPWDGVNDK